MPNDEGQITRREELTELILGVFEGEQLERVRESLAKLLERWTILDLEDVWAQYSAMKERGFSGNG